MGLQMKDKNPKLKKNGGNGTFVGNALRGIAKIGKEVAPELLEAASSILPDMGVLKTIGELIEDDKVLTQDEKNMLLERLRLDIQAFQAEVDDRKSARKMYSKDNLAQKILASLFCVAYFVITGVLLHHFFNGQGVLEDYELGLVSTLFGAMSSKVNTIIDFFFGGSMQNDKSKD
jgi:hypothetical protein